MIFFKDLLYYRGRAFLKELFSVLFQAITTKKQQLWFSIYVKIH
jgi:hypothetical protein